MRNFARAEKLRAKTGGTGFLWLAEKQPTAMNNAMMIMQT